MKIILTLVPDTKTSLLPVNYQFPLSAAIYKIIQQADKKYSAFLHDTGYRLPNGKSYKLFVFSDLRMPFQIKGDRMQINASPASLVIGFHIEEAAAHFISGLFINQRIEIGDKLSKTRFSVSQVQLLQEVLPDSVGEVPKVILQPLSPIVVGRKNTKGNYDFLSPLDPDFPRWLTHNWLEKYKASVRSCVDEEALKKSIDIKVINTAAELKSRLITIKAFTPAQTKIKGYTKFRMSVKAPKPLLELALNAGMGLFNAQGMGCVELAY
jgi:CRISPR-associated endoribonuclease Cas6